MVLSALIAFTLTLNKTLALTFAIAIARDTSMKSAKSCYLVQKSRETSVKVGNVMTV